jgi:uncharacterized repeat protein (TIGR03803 family)
MIKRAGAISTVALAASLSFPAQSFAAILHTFTGGDGDSPASTLASAGGNYFGTTLYGGVGGAGGSRSGWGTVYEISATGSFSSLYKFTNGADGGTPSGLTYGTDGNFYGTTSKGGAHGFGTVFQLTGSGTLSTLYSFNGSTDGLGGAALVQGKDGNLYGTSTGGGSGHGTLFEINASTHAFSTLHTFGGGASDGAAPMSGLIQASDGNFYGTTSQGGSAGGGTVFKMDQTGGVTVLHSFAYTDPSGFSPFAALVQGSDGSLYGSTYVGGYGGGALFKLNADGSSFAMLRPFGTGFYGGQVPGASPLAAMIQGLDGYFYGTTTYTSPYSLGGTVFKVSSDGSYFTDVGGFTPSYGSAPGGSNPMGGLVQGSDGTLFGTAASDGLYGRGVVYSIPLNAAPVPEADVYVMMLAGLGMIGFAVGRRKTLH